MHRRAGSGTVLIAIRFRARIGADCITYGMESRKSNSLLVKLALCDRVVCLVIRPFAEGDLTAGIRSRHSSSIQTILRLINEIVTYSDISYRNRDAFCANPELGFTRVAGTDFYSPNRSLHVHSRGPGSQSLAMQERRVTGQYQLGHDQKHDVPLDTYAAAGLNELEQGFDCA